MNILSSLLNGESKKSTKPKSSAAKSATDAAKKPHRSPAAKRPAPAKRRGLRREIAAAEAVREALLRG